MVLCFDICCAVNDHGGQVAPWEEENGLYAIMVGDDYIVLSLSITVTSIVEFLSGVFS